MTTEANDTSQNQTNEGGDDAAAAAAAAAAATAGEGDQGGGEAKSWIEQLPEALRGDPNLTKYESLDAFAKGHLNALKRMGVKPERLLTLPEKADDAEAWKALYGKLGRPDTPEGYNLEVAAEAPDDVKATVTELTGVFHEIGLNPAQAQRLVALLGEKGVAAAKAEDDATKAAATACKTTLTAEWGAKFPVYEREIGQLILDTVGEDGLADLNKTGYGSNLTLMKLLAKFSDMRAEPSIAPGGDGNPDTSGRGLTPYQAIQKIAEMRADPTKAAALEDKSNAAHKVTYDELQRLRKIAYPSQTKESA